MMGDIVVFVIVVLLFALTLTPFVGFFIRPQGFTRRRRGK